MKQKKPKKRSLFTRPKLRVRTDTLKSRIPDRLKRRTVEPDVKLIEAIQNLPRITNETVAEHREEVLSSARKYIYPLSHSKRRIIIITSSLLVLAIVLFFSYCSLALYKFKSTSTFMYGVTQVIPFPVAKAGSSWVSYESYLFELRHSVHYYQTQQKEDFSTPSGKAHLANLEQASMNQVVQDAYVKQLAAQHHISVSSSEVDNEVVLLKTQNRLGSNDQVFRNVLSEFWGWTEADFRRELRSQLLAEKVAATLDTAAQQRAQQVLNQLRQGADFGTLASQNSDDVSTKSNGGNYGIAITQDTHQLSPNVIAALFQLKAGQVSGIIDTGYSLEIDKVLDTNGTTLHATHIVFNLQPISAYTKPLAVKHQPHYYIKIGS